MPRRPRYEEPLYQAVLLPVGVLFVFLSVVLWLLAFDQPLHAQLSLLVGVISLITYVVLRPEGIGGILAQLFHWSTAYRINNWVLIVAVTGIVVILNILTYRHSVKTDYTQRQLYSLSEQTKAILSGLKEEVKVIGFYPDVKGQSQDAQILSHFRRKVKDMLEDYQRYSKDHLLKYELVDPFKDPVTAKKYQLGDNDWGTVFFETGKRKVKVPRDKLFARVNPFMMQGLPPFKGEEAFTGALLELTSGAAVTVYFAVGHGEKQIDTDQPSGFGGIKQLMERERYTVKTLELGRIEKIPDDCSVLVVGGPSRGFTAPDLEKIRTYLTLPGKGAMFLLDIHPQPGLKELLTEYGVEWTPNIVIETNASFALLGSRATVVAAPQGHKVTEELRKGKVFVALHEATYLNRLAKPTDKFEISSLVESTPSAWAMYDLNSLATGQVRFNEGTDRRGPLTLGVAVEIKHKPGASKPDDPSKPDEKKEDEPKARVVVIGDSDFATDRILMELPDAGNADLMLNSIGWLSFSNEKIATIRPKDTTSPSVTLSNEAKARIGRLTIIVYPLTILVLGILVWYRRSSL